MRCWCFAGSFALAVLTGAACAADPDAGVAEKDSAFFLAACQNSVNNLAAVGRLAAEENWTSKPGALGFLPLKIYGCWSVERDSRTYTITAATDPKGVTVGSVSFSQPWPRRDDVVASLAKSLQLSTLADARGYVRMEGYQVENLSPSGSTLEINSLDGFVNDAMIAGPIPERSPPQPPGVIRRQ